MRATRLRATRLPAFPAVEPRLSPRLQQRLAEQRRDEVVEKQKQVRPRADRAPALAVERHDGFEGDLPRVRHVGESGIHRSGGLFSPWRIEREFDQRDELMQWLLSGKRTGRIAAGEIVRAVLDRKAPMQSVHV